MALKRISLQDFVIVRQLDLELESGFSVLTGETGAGKSILIDALQLALGGRGDAGVVREGCRKADICAEFDCPASVHTWLDEAGFAIDEALLLRRTVDNQGKSRAWVNGSPATLAQLRHLGEQLVDIHGQHAWAMLTRANAGRALLDAYAGLDTSAIEATWRAWRDAQRQLAQAQASQELRLQERERLTWQISELDKLNPGADEWAELDADHTRLSHGQALMEAAQASLDALQDEQNGAAAQLARALHTLQNKEHIEPVFKGFSEVLAGSLAQLEDAAHGLHSYLGQTELDPARLAELDNRVSAWVSLARRYKRAPAELFNLHQSWKNELAQLDAASDLAALTNAEQHAAKSYGSEAARLSKQRQHAAPKLAKAITEAMQGLGMGGGRFEVSLTTSEQANAWGKEQIEFLVAGHAGSSARPIAKVASGGELSRIALAIAVTTSSLGSASTLIFDEVDSGVGGAVAETVGRLMKQLGRDRQVLAVTHLPQVAACADHHLVVSKNSDANGAFSHVQPVSGEQRVAEVARMLGGERLSVTTLAHAEEMLGGLSGGAR